MLPLVPVPVLLVVDPVLFIVPLLMVEPSLDDVLDGDVLLDIPDDVELSVVMAGVVPYVEFEVVDDGFVVVCAVARPKLSRPAASNVT